MGLGSELPLRFRHGLKVVLPDMFLIMSVVVAVYWLPRKVGALDQTG